MRISTLVIAVACLAVLALPAGAAPPPKQRITQLERQVAALKTKVKQLQQQKTDLLKDAARASRREEALRRYAASEGSCAVTFPNGSQPPDGNIGGPGVHGNGLLWVSLGSPVVVNDADPDGAVPEKFPWWRGVSGSLRIDGRRLDGPAPPLSANIPAGYGSTGFQASVVSFPTEGCWEVTGRAGEASLTIVTLVLKSIG
jgi:outer membrane murein-binding lipoprotein Lpp